MSDTAIPIFRMRVEHVFPIMNYGVAVAGTVQRGFITLHDSVFITVNNERVRLIVSDLEVTFAAPGQMALALRDFQPEDIKIGTIITSEDL